MSTFWQILKKSWRIVAPVHKTMYIIFGLVILGQIINMLIPAIFGRIVDAISRQAQYSDVITLAIILLIAGLVSRLVVSYYRETQEIKNLDFDASREITRVSLGKLCSFSIGQHKNRNSGIKQSIVRDGEEALMQFVYTAEFQIIPIILQIIITAGILLIMNWVLSLIVLAGLGAYVGITFFLNFHLRDELKKFEEMRHDNNKVYTEVIRNIPLIKVNAMEDKAIAEYLENFDSFADFGKSMWLRYTSYSRLRNILPGLTIFTVMAVSAWYAQSGRNTAGDVVMFMFWTSQIFGQLEGLGNLHRRLTESYTTIKKYFAMLDVEPDIKIVDRPVKMNNLQSEIEFSNVSFSYPVRKDIDDDEAGKPEKSAHQAISNISFNIRSGEKVAFVGSSGAGKSTLVDLILRAYDPDQGRILIGGHDLRTIDHKSYLHSIGHVEQEVTLFDKSLKHNIIFGINGKAELLRPDTLRRIIKESRISTFYDNLEEGDDTIIGERGVKLSGGEKQRVGIARAMIKSPKFLIFDEATSNLDSENEAYIQEAIRRVAKGRTTIIVAHRLSTVRDADKIFVLDKGRIVGQGTHETLTQTCPDYQKLVINQIGTL